MSRKRRSFMSEQLKNELAKDLGFYDTVQREGWGGIKAKDAGNMVKRAIQLAEEAAARQSQPQSAQTVQAPPHVQAKAQPQHNARTVLRPTTPTVYAAGFVQPHQAHQTNQTWQHSGAAASTLQPARTASVELTPPYFQPAAVSSIQQPTQYR